MTNAASELADLLESWEMVGERPEVARGGGANADDAEFWRGQGHAAKLVHTVDAAVQALQASGTDVRGFTRYTAAWHRAVFSVDYGWAQAYNAPAIGADALAALRALAVILDWGSPTSGATTAQSGQLRELVRDVRDLLTKNEGAIGGQELQYLLRLMSAVEDALEEHSATGAVDLREHLDRLEGALMSVAAKLAADGHEEEGRKVLTFAMRFVSVSRGLLYDAAAFAAISGMTASQLLPPA